MLKVSEYFRYFGPFDYDPIRALDGYALSDTYATGIRLDSRVRLHRYRGGKVIDIDNLRRDFATLTQAMNNLTDHSFSFRQPIDPSKFQGVAGDAIVTHDEITVKPRADMTNVTRNRIPILDRLGNLPMPNSDKADTTKGRWINDAGSEWLKVKKDAGQYEFAVNSTAAAWLDVNGWASALPSDTAEPSDGFAIWFDEDRSLWLFYKDNDIIGVVNGNVQTNNFRVSEPGDDSVYAAEEAYVLLNDTDNRIDFFCKTTEDDAIKGVGYIDSSGTNDGEA